MCKILDQFINVGVVNEFMFYLFQMQCLFFQNYKEEKGFFRMILKDKVVKKVVMLYLVKEFK